MSEAANIIDFPSTQTVEGVLVQISIRQWKGIKIDRNVTDEVAIEKTGECRNVGSYQKRLFSKDALGRIGAVASKARELNYLFTMPWSDVGQRLLPAPQLFVFSEKMKDLKANFEAEVETFIRGYEKWIERSEVRLGNMFNPGDYPSVAEVRSKFSFDYYFSEVPTGDLRIAMSEEDKASFREQVLRDNDQRLFAGVESYIEKLAEKLRHYRDKVCADREGGKGGIFRDSSLDEVGAVTGMVRAMNLTHDHRLMSVIDDIEKLAADINSPDYAETVRNSPNARANGRDKADDILKRMGFA
jgi:hypothetical protein